MTIKRHDDAWLLVLIRQADRFANECSVPQMDAIEGPDRDGARLPFHSQIVNSKVNGYTQNLHPTNNFQTGWTVGANLRFLYLLSARVAYTYYPYSLFQKDDLYRRALSFSLGF